MARIDFFYVEAGGGHKAAATALKGVIERQGRSWEVRLVNMNDVLGALDVVRKVTGAGIDDVYNLLIKKGWTRWAPHLMPVMHAAIRLTHARQVRMLSDFWRAAPPDMVVSLMPHFNRAMWHAFQAVNPGAPFVTVITDLADIPPRVWLERQPQYVVCGTERAVEQAYAFGHPPERVFRVSGMVLRPAFYETPPADRREGRARLGLREDLATGIVLFGSEGAGVMAEIARRLDASGLAVQLILMYGRNEALGRKLRGLGLKMPHHIQGFTAEVPRFMQLADFMIGKPGPGSISEALQMKLVVIVDLNASTLEQERYNTEWVKENGYGLVVKSWKEIAQAVGRLLEPGELERYRERVAGYENRALYEIPEILGRVLRGGLEEGGV